MDLAERLEIHRSEISGRVRLPGSKSLTNRALVVAALAEGRSLISGGLAGDDSESMVEGLRLLGAGVRELGTEPPSWEVDGTGGRVGGPGPGASGLVIDANLAGTTLRFLTAVAALGAGGVTVTGRGGLLGRPVGDLLTALRSCGADVRGSGPGGDRAPVHVGARGRLGGSVVVEAGSSSQFVTALLLAGPCMDEDLELEVRDLADDGFVRLTIEVMEHFGAEVDPLPRGYRVRAGAGYHGADYEVPPDASAAAHLATLALAVGGTVTLEALAAARSQPDYGFVTAVVAAAGGRVREEAGGAVTVSGPRRLRPLDVDLRAMPDQLPSAAVLAALAPGTSVLRGVGITRHHETDRMAAVKEELNKAGVEVELTGDDVVVHGGTARPGAVLDSHGDHRMAMALAALAAAIGGCLVEGAGAVSKTYRAFWRDACALGLRALPQG
ncbi:MAG TPA: 3-phosphoshikimate 1-carboxyvinyltransferase [Acidimicrobiales bacterium]|nr:3-phosphoshikimate 1-carboxyvinyltransferase [Acidimicrobiales bacterium]